MRRATPIALAFAALIAAADASAQIVLSPLPISPGAATSDAIAVNTAGTIVGSMNFPDAPFSRAVMWAGGVPIELARHCPTCNAAASDINDLGDISGDVTTADGVTHAAVWRNGVLTLLPPLPGHVGAFARSINDAGVLAGYSIDSAGVLRPVRWINGAVEDLGMVPGLDMPWGIALAINNAGDIVGAVRTLDNQEERGFVWRNGVMTALEALPAGACNQYSGALANNDSGLIVGYVFVNCRQTAAVWDHGVLHILPPLPPNPGFPFPAFQGGGSALDINEHGDIVGLGNPTFGPAALWRDAIAIELGSLEPPLFPNVAFDINDAGVAVGWSMTGSGRRAVMWTTTPPNTAPVLDLPGEITVAADSPAGATVLFTATVNDNEDGGFPATCSPASGSHFAVGSTTVECDATDSGGLEAAGSFIVTVVGAYEQVEDLQRAVSMLGPGGSLHTKLSAVLESLQPSSMLRASPASASPAGTGNACARLQAFINEVRAQAGKKITAAEAAAFIATAERIRAVIGC